MSDEQSTSGTSTNPAAPVMDVTPPPSSEPAVVDAPPEATPPATSDDIADQLAADATTPPEPSKEPVEDSAATEKPAPTDGTPDKSGEQTTAVHDELKKQQAVQEAVQKLPKAANPGRKAAVATVIATVCLAVLAVFAYMSTQK